MNSTIITTGHKSSLKSYALARQIASEWKLPFVDRENHSLQYFLDQTEAVVVVTDHGPVIQTTMGSHFFHLNLAELRIKNIQNGKHDHMVQAMQLQTGMSVLDCTLGLAVDAVVASFVLGDQGRLTGLESSYLLAKTAEYGLQNFVNIDENVTAALRRITVHIVDYEDYLSDLPDNCYEVVYFDPMFRYPIKSSSQLNPVRTLTNSNALSRKILAEALRVASQRVVIKETRGSLEFHRLGVEHTMGGKYSRIQYGILEKQVGA